MFEKFRKKKQPEITHRVLPEFDYKNCSEDELKTFFKSLTRTQLLDISDTIDFDEVESRVDFHKVYYEVQDWHSWPYPSDVSDALKTLIWGKDDTHSQVKKLVIQVDGMQKKLDKALVLISNAEFKLCGKDAMKL